MWSWRRQRSWLHVVDFNGVVVKMTVEATKYVNFCGPASNGWSSWLRQQVKKKVRARSIIPFLNFYRLKIEYHKDYFNFKNEYREMIYISISVNQTTGVFLGFHLFFVLFHKQPQTTPSFIQPITITTDIRTSTSNRKTNVHQKCNNLTLYRCASTTAPITVNKKYHFHFHLTTSLVLISSPCPSLFSCCTFSTSGLLSVHFRWISSVGLHSNATYVLFFSVYKLKAFVFSLHVLHLPHHSFSFASLFYLLPAVLLAH